jgi:hypothetical protein
MLGNNSTEHLIPSPARVRGWYRRRPRHRWWDLVTRDIIIFRKIRTSTTIATTDVVEMVRRQCEVVKQGPCTASSNKKRPGQPQAGDPAYDSTSISVIGCSGSP